MLLKSSPVILKIWVGLCTDGAPAMCGKTNGVMALLQEHIERKIIINHCITHRQVLCSKVLEFGHVMLVAVSIIYYLRTRKLNYRLFKSVFEEAGLEYGDVVYHTDLRWPSRANILQRFVALKPQISKFLETEPKEFSELNDSSWMKISFSLSTLLFI